jgi:hypothetical protein
VLLEDITVFAVPGMAVIGWQSQDITIKRIKVVPAEGGWMSATADAMHFGGCRGLITVEASEFAGMGDDAINIHGMYGMVTKRFDDHTVEVGRARMNAYYDTERGTWDEPLLPQGQLTVVAAHQDVTSAPMPATGGRVWASAMSRLRDAYSGAIVSGVTPRCILSPTFPEDSRRPVCTKASGSWTIRLRTMLAIGISVAALRSGAVLTARLFQSCATG